MGRGVRVLVSAKGREWKQAAAWHLAAQVGEPKPSSGGVAVSIVLHPPTRRKTDVDNRAKVVLDALQGWMYEDDSQVWRLSCERREVRSGGLVVVTVTPDPDPWRET